MNGLRMRRSWGKVPIFVALGSIVSHVVTMETSSLTDAFGSFLGRVFKEEDHVDIHGIGVSGG